MAQKSQQKKTRPAQQQRRQPGVTREMKPQPKTGEGYLAAGKMKGKVALITGGDSGIGRAVARLFAKEGAHVAIAYLNEHEDAKETERLVKAEGKKCLLLPGDIGQADFCRQAVERVVGEFGKLDILVNNAAEQHPQDSLEKITEEQLVRTFRTNIFSMFFLTSAALPHLGAGASILNTTSITAYRGHEQLVDYAATKGAIVAFTRSLARQLSGRGIRVNGVAPGPIWTPLIPSTFPPEKVETFGANTLFERPGEPEEVATCFVFLASSDGSYLTGQVLHPDGGAYTSS